METTQVVDDAQIAALADRLDQLEDRFTDDERLALHAVFALAAEALEARAEVAGFAAGGASLQLGLAAPAAAVPPVADGLRGALGRKAVEGKTKYLAITLTDVIISSY